MKVERKKRRKGKNRGLVFGGGGGGEGEGGFRNGQRKKGPKQSTSTPFGCWVGGVERGGCGYWGLVWCLVGWENRVRGGGKGRGWEEVDLFLWEGGGRKGEGGGGGVPPVGGGGGGGGWGGSIIKGVFRKKQRGGGVGGREGGKVLLNPPIGGEGEEQHTKRRGEGKKIFPPLESSCGSSRSNTLDCLNRSIKALWSLIVNLVVNLCLPSRMSSTVTILL